MQSFHCTTYLSSCIINSSLNFAAIRKLVADVLLIQILQSQSKSHGLHFSLIQFASFPPNFYRMQKSSLSLCRTKNYEACPNGNSLKSHLTNSTTTKHIALLIAF